MKLLVCGSRPPCKCRSGFYCTVCYDLRQRVREKLAQETDAVDILAGGARGPDAWAAEWGRERMKQVSVNFSVTEYPALWLQTESSGSKRYNPAAGLERNERMLNDGKPDKVLAFWDGRSRGTKHMIEIARKAGVPVEIVVMPKP